METMMSQQVAGEAHTTSRVTERAAWSPAQIVGVAGGVVLIAIGAVALARTGTNFSNVAATHAAVAGFGFTSVSAAVQLAAGVLLLAFCAFPVSAKSAMAFFGVLILAWGIVIVADVTRLFTVWGYTKNTGVFYIIVGGVLLVVAAVSPIFMSSRRDVNRGGVQSNEGTTPSGV
jgi:hypothetical protein